VSGARPHLPNRISRFKAGSRRGLGGHALSGLIERRTMYRIVILNQDRTYFLVEETYSRKTAKLWLKTWDHPTSFAFSVQVEKLDQLLKLHALELRVDLQLTYSACDQTDQAGQSIPSL
jgi:hypothetical protein